MKLPCSAQAEQGFSELDLSSWLKRTISMTLDEVKPLRIRSGLTRESLRDAIYSAVPNLTRDSAKRILDQVFEEIIRSLVLNEQVNLRGFGKFKVQHKRARLGRNPRTQVSATITARRVTKFVPCRTMISKVNKGS